MFWANKISPEIFLNTILYVISGNLRGTYVTQISATDEDEGSNGRITYSIIGGNSQNAFVIDPPNTGIVKTNIILDREIKDSYRYSLLVFLVV